LGIQQERERELERLKKGEENNTRQSESSIVHTTLGNSLISHQYMHIYLFFYFFGLTECSLPQRKAFAHRLPQSQRRAL